MKYLVCALKCTVQEVDYISVEEEEAMFFGGGLGVNPQQWKTEPIWDIFICMTNRLAVNFDCVLRIHSL